MGNRLHATFISTAIVGLSFAVLLSPLFASAASRSIVDRLCARQDSLGSRLARLLIDPEICHPTPPPTLDFTADPTAIDEGGSSTLEWSSTNATSCEASNGWSGAKILSGNEVVTPAVTTTYTLTCIGINGTVEKSATVTVAPTPTLTLIKNLPNNNGGTATAANFQAKIDGVNVPWGVAQPVSVGAHTASETTLAGYTPGSWGGDCAAGGSVTLAGGQNKTCTITNDDQPGTLHVVKVVTNNNSGTKTAVDFSFQVDGGTATAFEADGTNDVTVNAGTYTVTEPPVDGYTTTYDNCTNVVIPNGGSATCTVTNDDAAPTTGHLIVDKVTQPGGDPTEFTINASGTGTVTGGGAGTVTDATSKDYEVTAGTYDVSETPPTGWVVISNTCTDIVVAAGTTENCTITNGKLPTLTVVKVVVNDNSGTKQIADFPLFIDGSPVVSWATTTVATGTRTVSETNQSGYTATIGGDCASNGTITLAYGDVKNCTITNDDIAPNVNHLLISEVYYDVGGTHGSEATAANANEWFELYNPTNSLVDLTNWWIMDATTLDKIPDGTNIPAGGRIVIAATSTTSSFWGDTPMIVLGSAIGSGFSNTGDALSLLNANGATTTVDAVGWGDDISIFNPAPSALEDHSLIRSDVNVDTDTAADWADDATPTPGAAN
ncbi:MAG: lamin tail domain-containing protein [Patescibacteria group bacterium]